MSSETRSTSGWFAHGGLVVVLCCFCVPLFVGLRGWDIRNDEAIYSYAIESILDTGDWLTPHFPGGAPFLEKPPLKLWIVAAAIRAGLLPNDEFGLRFFDALFGAASFVYVFYLGRLLAGSLCGIVALLILFTIDPLLFSHGLRENGMDAPLVLAYCGAIYHFARWVEDSAARRRAIHALAVAAYFTLGFMTKFVAVLFLPVVCALAFMWRDDALRRVRAQWREWIPATLVILAATAPWFVYQALHSGSLLWQTMFGQHVYVRFTSALDPVHLQPWHFYFSHLRAELAVAGSLWISLIGLLMLTYKAWTGRPWLARLVLLWWIVPFGLMSIGTSKMFHYTYPFLPPIALGVGLVAESLFRAIERGITLGARLAFRRLQGFERSRVRQWPVVPIVRQLLAAVAAVALAVAVWTAAAGRVRWEINGVRLLQNSSVARPLIVAGVLFCLTGYARVVSAGLALASVAVLLPVRAYPLKLERAASVDRPLHTVRECVLGLKASPRDTHVYPTYISHSYYYYLRHLGPWVEHAGSPKDDDLQRLLLVPGEQTIMVLLRTDYERFTEQIDKERRIPIGLALSADSAEVLMTPGPFEVCGAAAVAAGAPGIVGRVDGNQGVSGR